MWIYSTTGFNKEFEKLNKNKKHYSCLEKHLSNFIFDKSFEPKGDLLRRLKDGYIAVYKARLSSCTKRGKSYGFRLIYLVTSTYYILLEVYPKWGPQRADDVTSEGVHFLISEALSEKENQELMYLTKDKKKGKLKFHSNIEIQSSESAINEEE